VILILWDHVCRISIDSSAKKTALELPLNASAGKHMNPLPNYQQDSSNKREEKSKNKVQAEN
jgi:hypothetical protein